MFRKSIRQVFDRAAQQGAEQGLSNAHDLIEFGDLQISGQDVHILRRIFLSPCLYFEK